MAVEATFTDELMRRAAFQLRDHADAPTDGLAPDDPLSRLMAELSVRAAGVDGSSVALRGDRLQLEILAVAREKRAARAAGRPTTPLTARERELREEYDRAVEQKLAESQPAT
jgi:hypothetical protein